MKRLLPYLPLALGTLGLAWALFALAAVFADEREAALRALGDERRALARHADDEMRALLRGEVERREAELARAEVDPFAETAARLWRGDAQVRPLWSRVRVDKVPALPRVEPRVDELHLRELTVALWAGKVDPAVVDDPVVAARLRAVRGLAAGAEGIAHSSLLAAAADWAMHRKKHLLAPWWEASTSVAGFAILVNQQQVPLDGSFLNAALFGDEGIAGPGVVTHLLDAETRARLPRRDLDGLLGLVRPLAQDAGLLPPRFDATVRELLTHAPRPPPVDPGLWFRLTESGAEVALREGGRTVVLPVEPAALVARLRFPREGVRARVSFPGQWGQVLNIDLDAAVFDEAAAAVEARHRLKIGLLAGLAGLWILVVALSFALVRRRQRFVELKDGFVSAVSHELRTPLASIRLQAETLERKLKDDPRAREYPARIVHDIDGLAFLVENLLSFSRLERGRITPSRAPTRVDELVAASRDHVSRAITVPIEWRVSGVEGVTLSIDPDLVRLCLDNLAKNGAQYNERRPVVIEVKGRQDDEGFALRVSDNGVGIDEADRARVFEDFYRGRTERAVRGSGLGLAICVAVMRAHGGSVRLVDTSAEGTTFELRFPASARA